MIEGAGLTAFSDEATDKLFNFGETFVTLSCPVGWVSVDDSSMFNSELKKRQEINFKSL